MTRDEWLALAERFEAAKVGNSDLSNAILTLLGYKGGGKADDGGDEWTKYDDNGNFVCNSLCVASSIDAIKTLIDRELPNHPVEIDLCAPIGSVLFGCRIYRCLTEGPVFSRISTLAGSPALTACAAFCRAFAAKQPAQ
jgi:hypothetical protein